MTEAEAIKNEIFSLVEKYSALVHAPKSYEAGQSAVPVSGKVFDHKELQYIVDSALDGWFTTGRFNHAFEHKLAKYIGTSKLLTVNSGSSTNLVAVSAFPVIAPTKVLA